MAAPADNASMALFCDFENIALGVRDAQYEKFDIRPVLERLLAKGSIVVKKAYCDWERYKGFKAAMHEANFELIEIPHVRQSGKNSADIRMVVDALDLCYTKAHVDTFVIISGDSDFSPLVSKLRENAKRVIGVGVKQSCSDLLVTNCDEFIYYDDLVRDRESGRAAGQRREREKRSPEEEARRSQKLEERKGKAVDLVSTTFIDLVADRGESERIWASVLKEVVKRRNPGFNETYYGFRSFGNLLEEAANRGLLGFGRDDKGAFVFRAPPRPLVIDAEPVAQPELAESQQFEALEVPAGDQPSSDAEQAGGNARRRGNRRSRNGGRERTAEVTVETNAVAEALPAETVEPLALVLAAPVEVPPNPVEVPEAAVDGQRRGGRRSRKADTAKTAAGSSAMPAEVSSDAGVAVESGLAAPAEKKAGRAVRRPRKTLEPVAAAEVPSAEPVLEMVAVAPEVEKKPARAKRPSRPRKPKAAER